MEPNLLFLLCSNTVGSFSAIFLDRVYEEHVTSHKSHRGQGYPNQMDFGAFLDFMLAWDNRSSWVGIQYFFPVLDLKGRGYLTQVQNRCSSLLPCPYYAVTMLLPC